MNDYDVAGLPAGGPARLIVTAALHWDSAPDRRLRGAVQEAFGEVAVDVLHMCGTRHAFHVALTEALTDHPVPHLPGSSRESAIERRRAWSAALVSDVTKRLAS